MGQPFPTQLNSTVANAPAQRIGNDLIGAAFWCNGCAVVGDESIKIDARDERLDADAVVTLAGQQDKARLIAQRIDERDNLGRQPAARPADGLILSPPFAPAPCR